MIIRFIFTATVGMLLLYVTERVILICINSNKSIFIISNYNQATGLLQVMLIFLVLLISFGIFYQNELEIISGEREESIKHLKNKYI